MPQIPERKPPTQIAQCNRECDTPETSRKIRELEHVSRKACVQSARVLEVPIPELSDRGIRTGVADSRVDGPALTGFRLLDYRRVVGPILDRPPNQRAIEHIVLA